MLLNQLTYAACYSTSSLMLHVTQLAHLCCMLLHQVTYAACYSTLSNYARINISTSFIIMLGSLEEFIPEIFTPKEYLSQRKTLEHNQEAALSQDKPLVPKNKVFWGQARSKNVEISAINYTSRSKGTEEVTPTHQDESNSQARAQVQQAATRVLSSEKAKSKRPLHQYVPSDKSMLLQSYKRLKNGSQMQERGLLELKRMHLEMQQAASNSAKKKSFFHLKGKLKHNHHLLKSLVRVEEQETFNQKTAFQISFKNMSNQFKEIRLQSKLRSMDKVTSSFKNMRLPLFLNKKQLQKRSSKLSYPQPQEAPAGSKELSLKIVDENTKKWVKLRSKSVQSQQQKRDRLTPNAKSLELRETEQQRKKMMGNISKLVNRPKHLRKNPDQGQVSRRHSFNFRKSSSYISTA